MRVRYADKQVTFDIDPNMIGRDGSVAVSGKASVGPFRDLLPGDSVRLRDKHGQSFKGIVKEIAPSGIRVWIDRAPRIHSVTGTITTDKTYAASAAVGVYLDSVRPQGDHPFVESESWPRSRTEIR